jgi:hypothetical protein
VAGQAEDAGLVALHNGLEGGEVARLGAGYKLVLLVGDADGGSGVKICGGHDFILAPDRLIPRTGDDPPPAAGLG